MTEILTRRQAVEAGLTRYSTGKPCSKGHGAPRFTSTGACVKCAAGYVKAYNAKLRKETNARASGLFTYPLHPDDTAAALAYCQALDIQRGRSPHVPRTSPAPSPTLVVTLPDHIARHREILLASYAPTPGAAHLPKP